MLDLFNNLSLFFEDAQREFNVREYARLMKITAPTASVMLKDFEKKGLLKSRIDKKYMLFRANNESDLFKDLSSTYWKEKLKSIGLINELNNVFINPLIILFGSLSKIVNTKDSDVDLCIISPVKKEVNLSSYERKLCRSIQLMIFKSFNEIKNKELRDNIINGIVVSGRLSYGLD